MAEHRLPNQPWTESFVNERLANLDAPAPALRRAPGDLQKAAAVLAYYDPSELQRHGERIGASDSLVDVLSDSTVVYQGDRPQAMLKTEARREALEALGSQRAIREVLDSLGERPTTPLQRMVDGYVTGRPRILDLQSLDELSATRQVTQWFTGLIDLLPDLKELERRIERETLLKPFRDLAGQDFAGRRDELRMLRNYVGFLDAETPLASLERGYYSYVSGFKPMVLHAPGGMGKSTLLGRFILDHLEPLGMYPALPFVYLDFDRPVLLPERLPTLFLEAARQLSLQLDDGGTTIEELKKLFPLNLGPSEAVSRFASFVRERRPGTQGPMLFVLDTFEEVQYRGPSAADDVLMFFARVQETLQEARVVVAGRAPVTSSRVQVDNRHLGALRSRDAADFLFRRAVDDPEIANAIVAQVGGNPLTLRLVLEVLREDPERPTKTGIPGISGRNRFLFVRLSDTQIQGQLYSRILDHITHPDVRKLAHPGLVLRRVTAEIIKDVLAEPCGVSVPDLDHATRLLAELQREVSLVTVNTDGSLQHLQELRPIMLDLLRTDRPVQVNDIQTRAVEYYARQTDNASRAELIYHLLMLQRDRSEIDAAWRPGVERFLRASIDEVPANVRPYLTARLGDDVKASLGVNIDLPIIEAKLAVRVRDLLAANRLAEAAEHLATLSERSQGSVLHLVEVEMSILHGEWAAAYDRANHALSEAAYFTDPQSILKLEVARAWAARGVTTSPPASPEEIERLAARFAGEPLVVRYALHRLASTRNTWTRNAIITLIERQIRTVPSDRRSRYPFIFVEAAGLLGSKAPELVLDVVRNILVFNLLEPGPRTLHALQTAMDAWDASFDGRLGLRGRSERATGAEIARLLQSASNVYDIPPPVTDALSAAFADMTERWRTDRHLFEELEEIRARGAASHGK